MVENTNAQNPRRLDKLLLDLQVRITWLDIPGRVVVRKDDSGGAVGDHVGEDISWMNEAPVEKPNGDNTLFDDLIRAVERDTDEMLLWFIGYFAE